MHNVHEKEPVTFETRWTLSYLRGPLTRDELRKAIGTPAAAATHRAHGTVAAASSAPAAAADKPVLPTGINEYFLPSPGRRPMSRCCTAAHASSTRTRSAASTSRPLCMPSRRLPTARSRSIGTRPRRRTSRRTRCRRPRPAPAARFGVLPAAARNSEELRGVGRRLRAVDRPREAAASVLGARLQAELQARRDRGGVRRAGTAGHAREARRCSGKAAGQVRAEGRARNRQDSAHRRIRSPARSSRRRSRSCRRPCHSAPRCSARCWAGRRCRCPRWDGPRPRPAGSAAR